MAERETIVPPKMQSLVERFGYAPGVKVGNMLYCAGQVGRDEHMHVIEEPEAHIVKAWENVGEVLAAGGAGFEHIVDIVTYHVDLQQHLELFIQVKDRFISRDLPLPAWTAIGVSELTLPGQFVEIKVTAFIPD